MKKFFYRVKLKDSLISVSKRFLVPTMLLIRDNNLKGEIEAGDILMICGYKNCYEVKPLDTLDSIAEKLNVTKEKLSFLNGGITYVFYGEILIY